MEITYIWIESYNEVLHQLNVNFQHQGPHRFSYKEGILELVTNHKSPLYFGEKIKGITAIAGKNGSGKSSICEVIIHAAATYVNGATGWHIPFSGIICYGDVIFYSETLLLNNKEELLHQGYQLSPFKDSPMDDLSFNHKPDFHKSGFIYYSNAIDNRSSIALLNLSNISTEYKIYNDFRYGNARLPNDFSNELPDLLNAHYIEQAYRHTKYYLNFGNSLPFEGPKYFKLKSTSSETNRFLDYKRIFNYQQYQYFEELESSIFDMVAPKHGEYAKDNVLPNGQTIVKEAIRTLYRFNVLVAKSINEGKLPDFEAASKFIWKSEGAELLFGDVFLVKQLLVIHDRLVDSGLVYQEYLSRELLDDNNIDWRLRIIEDLNIINNESNRSSLRDFMTIEGAILTKDHSIKRISNYSLYPFPSSGENSFYTIFSAIYDTILRYDAGYDNRTDLILFIDEGDVGFHPAWARKFLKWLIDFLNEDFNQYKFQIILTTHSPYLLSDLSSEHLILLKRDKGDKTQIIPSDDLQTFGANINELLADVFFLTEGQIGEFAKETIQKEIDHLNSWRLQKSNTAENSVVFVEDSARAHCAQIIGMIGDKIVRKKMFEMYWELFGEDEIIDHEILALEVRIKQLKERRRQ